MHKREWRILLEPGTKLGPSTTNYWVAPEITPESDPKDSTQLPEGLMGTRDGSWPYPWGAQGLKARLGQLAKLVAPEDLAAASNDVNKPQSQQPAQ